MLNIIQFIREHIFKKSSSNQNAWNDNQSAKSVVDFCQNSNEKAKLDESGNLNQSVLMLPKRKEFYAPTHPVNQVNFVLLDYSYSSKFFKESQKEKEEFLKSELNSEKIIYPVTLRLSFIPFEYHTIPNFELQDSIYLHPHPFVVRELILDYVLPLLKLDKVITGYNDRNEMEMVIINNDFLVNWKGVLQELKLPVLRNSFLPHLFLPNVQTFIFLSKADDSLQVYINKKSEFIYSDLFVKMESDYLKKLRPLSFKSILVFSISAFNLFNITSLRIYNKSSLSLYRPNALNFELVDYHFKSQVMMNHKRANNELIKQKAFIESFHGHFSIFKRIKYSLSIWHSEINFILLNDTFLLPREIYFSYCDWLNALNYGDRGWLYPPFFITWKNIFWNIPAFKIIIMELYGVQSRASNCVQLYRNHNINFVLIDYVSQAKFVRIANQKNCEQTKTKFSIMSLPQPYDLAIDRISQLNQNFEDNEYKSDSSEGIYPLNRKSAAQNEDMDPAFEFSFSSEDETEEQPAQFVENRQVFFDHIKSEYKYDSYDDFLKSIQSTLQKKRLIGLQLLAIDSDEEKKQKIHEKAQKYLNIYYSFNSCSKEAADTILISLSLIALDSYDGTFWEHVKDTYTFLYSIKSEQMLEIKMRSLLKKYADGDKRMINIPIRHAIVPKFYLYDFITIAFKIYSTHFHYKINENADHELVDIFLNLSSKYFGEEDSETKNSAFRSISTIKEMTNNLEWMGDLTSYTLLVLEYLDAYYWQNEDEHRLPFYSFFHSYFDQWRDDHAYIFKKRKRHNSVRRIAVSRPMFFLEENSIYLKIPDMIVGEIIDPQNIIINIYNREECLFSMARPAVYKDSRGFRIGAEIIKIENPLDELSVVISEEDKKLYSSKASLFREYMLFDEEGKELNSNSSYMGQYYGIFKIDKSIDNNPLIFQNANYRIYIVSLENSTPIDYFTSTNSKIANIHAHFIGNIYKHTYILDDEKNYPLYKDNFDMEIQGDIQPDQLLLSVNDYHYELPNRIKKLSDRKFSIKVEDLLFFGFNYLIIFDRYTNEQYFKQKIYYDPIYTSESNIYENNVEVRIKSLFVESKNYLADFNHAILLKIPFQLPNFDYELYLVPNIEVPVFRIEDEPWKLLMDGASIKDLSNFSYSSIQIKGFDFDQVKLVNSNKVIREIKDLEIKGDVYTFSIQNVLQFQGSDYAKISAVFYLKSIAVEKMDIYLKNQINVFHVWFDDKSGRTKLRISYFGADPVSVRILEQEKNKAVWSADNIDKSATFSIAYLRSFIPYTIQVWAGEEDLFSLNQQQYLIATKKNYVFSSFNSLSTMSFDIKGCKYLKYNRKEYQYDEKRRRINNVTLRLDDLIEPSLYNGVIFYISNDKKVSHRVVVEILDTEQSIKESEQSGIWSIITYNDESLFLDYSKQTFTVNPAVDNDPNIFEVVKIHMYIRK